MLESLSPDRFARLKDLFFACADLDPADRQAAIEAACGGDEELQKLAAELLEKQNARVAGLTATDAAGADFIPDDDPLAGPGSLAGQMIGPYLLKEKIGEGGMGVVYVAEQREPVRRRVALKLIKPGMDTRQVIVRFEAERQALALMDHPNIAKVLDAGTVESSRHSPSAVAESSRHTPYAVADGTRSVPATLGRPYFAMELVKGVPITKYCDELRLTLAERLALFIPVCQAIQHAHQKGIIHRDIKPNNVLVAMSDGQAVPKVIDFGVAKALHQPLTDESLYTEIGQLIGTLEYMSPEQAELSPLDIDTRADLYGLGVLLYELLTSTTPIERKRLRQAARGEMLRLIKEEEPPKPSTRLTDSHDSLASVAALRRTEPARLTSAVRGELDWIVMKCLEKDRTRRYDSAGGLARDLERYLHDEPVEACPPSAGYRFRKFARRNKAVLATAGTIALVLLAASLISSALAYRATQAERLAGERLVQKDQALQAAEESEQRAIAAAEKEKQALQDVLAERQRVKDAEELTLKHDLERQKANSEAEQERKRLRSQVASILDHTRQTLRPETFYKLDNLDEIDRHWSEVLADLRRCVELTPNDWSILRSDVASIYVEAPVVQLPPEDEQARRKLALDLQSRREQRSQSLDLLARRQLELARERDLRIDDPHLRLVLEFLDIMSRALEGRERVNNAEDVFVAAHNWMASGTEDWRSIQRELADWPKLRQTGRGGNRDIDVFFVFSVIASQAAGDTQVAHANCETLLKKNPGEQTRDFVTRIQAAGYVAGGSHREEYLEIARQLTQLKHFQGLSRGNLAIQHFRMSHWDEAVSELETTVRDLGPQNSRPGAIPYVAAMAYHRLGKEAESRAWLRRGDEALLRTFFVLCFSKGYPQFRDIIPCEEILPALLFRQEAKQQLPAEAFRGPTSTDALLWVERAKRLYANKDFFTAAGDLQRAAQADPTFDLSSIDFLRGQSIPAWLNRHAADESIALARQVVVAQNGRVIWDHLPDSEFEVEWLNLGGLPIGDADLGWLKGLRGVKRLWLSKTKVGDATLAKVADYPKLRWLTLSETAITNEGLRHVGKISSLRRLELDYCPNLTEDGLSYLAGSPLRELRLAGNRIGDRGLEFLSRIETLEDLRIPWTEISDERLRLLANLPRLKSLTLNDQVSRAECKSLVRLRPDLVITLLSGQNVVTIDRNTVDTVGKGEEPAFRVDSIIHDPNGTKYFFLPGQYQMWENWRSTLSPAYPLGRDRWNGVWTNRFEAALITHPYTFAYFFKGDQFLEFDMNEDRVVRKGTIGKEDWHGVWTDGLNGAVSHPNGFAYFFRGKNYQQYDLKLGKVVSTGEVDKHDFRGVWTDGIDAVMQFDDIAFFRQGEKYRRFDFEKNEVIETGRFVRSGWQPDPLLFAGRRMVLRPGAPGKHRRNNWRIALAKIEDPEDPTKMQLTVSELTDKEPPALVNTNGGSFDISTEDAFGDCSVSLEVLNILGGNNGIYLMGEYRLGVAGIFGEQDDQLHGNSFGAISHVIPPRKSVAATPGEWQKLEIEFQAPKFKGGRKVSNAIFVRVTANGTLLHENVELDSPTRHGSLTGQESATGPLMIHGSYSPIAIRNLQIIKK